MVGGVEVVEMREKGSFSIFLIFFFVLGVGYWIPGKTGHGSF